MGDKEIPKKEAVNGSKNKKKKKKRGGSKRRMTSEQTSAYNCVSEWVFLDRSHSPTDDFALPWNQSKEKLVFEFHSHSIHSDGFLSPSKLVERAHQNGVKVLSLTDHDTLSGIPEALEAASRFGIKIIPGVEISTMFTQGSQGRDSASNEPVHILAYYSSCGPAKFDQVDKFLSSIRDGRFLRAENMILKLNKLKLPVKWEQVAKIAGKGVAPGRLHVARAMVEAGHVENLRQAFSRYLYDGGPAYATGSEPLAEEAVQFICDTGGVAVLAHPWALKDPIAVVRRLKEVGLHGIEAYRSDGKLAAYSDLADAYNLLKLGGSDFHGRGGKQESEVGSVSLPMLAVHEFLKVARPIWATSIREILENYIKYPSETNLQPIMSFGKPKVCRGISPASCPSDFISRCLSLWLTDEERQNPEFEAIKLKLAAISMNNQ
ncbi:hypothetical protein HAX54_002776 [Datura stramonium]|uniref:Polymerase/histidinol phosphatase N-terminal domain-containing protein n=1 Tax=Datura stramonium TaxID=4076 RepID=A0ABS8T6I3_DATST|nr:hypothetical protein [Datura stramonium]